MLSAFKEEGIQFVFVEAEEHAGFVVLQINTSGFTVFVQEEITIVGRNF